MAILSHDRRRTKALSQAEAVLPIAISPPVSIDYRNLDILSDREDSSNWPAAEHSLRETSQAARRQAASQLARRLSSTAFRDTQSQSGATAEFSLLADPIGHNS